MSKYRPQHLQVRLSPAEKRTAWCLERVDGPSESKSSYGKMKRQGRGDCALGFFIYVVPSGVGSSHWPFTSVTMSGICAVYTAQHLHWNKNFINHCINVTKKWTQGECEVKHMFTTMWKTYFSRETRKGGESESKRGKGGLKKGGDLLFEYF